MQSGIYRYEPLWGEWKIDELIGKGSYGEVYRIYKMENGKRVEAAAKYVSIPKSEQDKDLAYSKGLATDEDSLKTFFEQRADAFSKEIDLMMKLRGTENVVKYEAHLKQEKPDDIGWDIIIRMELLTALETYLKENSFTQKDVIQLGIDICSAIESCQREKIIHRDVKIENIFIDHTGRFKLGDFGVSREAQGTTMGTITGTEDYMAPEIMKHEKYNNNVDIYSIGIVMYRLLNNNRIPFLPSDGPINDNDISLALTKRLEGTEPIPDPKFASGRLAEIIAKACAYDRTIRYASPREMAEDLASVLAVAENIEVLKPRKKTASRTADRTLSDVHISGSGGSTLSDFDGNPASGSVPPNEEAGTFADVPSAGTMSDIGTSKAPAKKKKWPIFAGIGAAVIVIAAIAVFFLLPKPVALQDIKGVPEETVQMVMGDTYEFKLEKYPAAAEGEITYRSSDEKIATVDENGVVTSIAVGEVTIEILVDGEVYDKVSLNVQAQKIPVTDIQGIAETAELEVGGSITLYGQVVPADATVQQLTYASSNPDVATVGPDGVVTGVSAGQVEITASADGITKTLVLTVKEKPVVTAKPKATQKPSSNTNTAPKTNSGSGGGYSAPVQQQPQPQPVNPPASNPGGGSSSGGREIANPANGYH